jgi:hypothetical protein
MLAFTEDDISSVIGDITYGPKIEKISLCKIYDKQIYLKNIQASEVVSINGKPYTSKYDILTPQNRCVILADISEYISTDDSTSIFELKYIS